MKYIFFITIKTKKTTKYNILCRRQQKETHRHLVLAMSAVLNNFFINNLRKDKKFLCSPWQPPQPTISAYHLAVCSHMRLILAIKIHGKQEIIQCPKVVSKVQIIPAPPTISRLLPGPSLCFIIIVAHSLLAYLEVLPSPYISGK